MRLTGNTFWLEKPDWKSFTDYEAAINDVIGKYHMLALCTYSLDKCGAAEIMDVIRNHEFALIRREGKWEIIENAIHKQARQAVLESEEKYRLLFQNMAEGFALYELLYDEEGQPVDWRVLEMNDAYTHHTGITRETDTGTAHRRGVPGSTAGIPAPLRSGSRHADACAIRDVLQARGPPHARQYLPGRRPPLRQHVRRHQ